MVKLLSVDPDKSVYVRFALHRAHDSYSDAPTEGVRRVLEWFTGESIPRSQPIDTSRIEYLRMGTTVATNALLERKGERCALLIVSPSLFRAAYNRPKDMRMLSRSLSKLDPISSSLLSKRYVVK